MSIDLETVEVMLKTRIEAAKQKGNNTEVSLMITLLEITNELKQKGYKTHE